MRKEQVEPRRKSSIVFMAAFGMITMSSNINSSFTTMNLQPSHYYEARNYLDSQDTVCHSSTLSKKVVGDIVSVGKSSDFIKHCEKIDVKLQITKITKYVSSFEFEEEYEEI